jgi:hypothetical protein
LAHYALERILWQASGKPRLAPIIDGWVTKLCVLVSGYCWPQVKKRNVSAKADRNSQGRVANRREKFVIPIRAVWGNGTSDRGDAAIPDSRFFGETLFLKNLDFFRSSLLHKDGEIAIRQYTKCLGEDGEIPSLPRSCDRRRNPLVSHWNDVPGRRGE